MKGLTMNEFYESLYYGADIDFSYNGLFYHINAGIDSYNVYGIIVYEYTRHPDEQQTHCCEIYNKSFQNRNDGIDEFLSNKLFNGKSFYDIEPKVEIMYS